LLVLAALLEACALLETTTDGLTAVGDELEARAEDELGGAGDGDKNTVDCIVVV
jgi:hypothetical protein